MKKILKNSILTLVLTLLFIMCGTPPHINNGTLLKMKKGMTLTQFDALLDIKDEIPLKTLDFKLKDNNIKVRVYTKFLGEVSNTYMIAFVEDRLLYWGYPYEFAKHSDTFINEVGALAYDKYLNSPADKK